MAKQSRAYQVGMMYAKGIITFIHLSYQRLTAIRFLQGLMFVLEGEWERRITEYSEIKSKKRRGKK